MTRLAALVLAAGGGSRMGSQKALLEFEGVPLVRRAVEAALASRAEHVFVVVGHRADEVADAVANLSVTPVENPEWLQGLSTSLRVGIEALERDGFDAALIALADQPHVDAALLDALVDAAGRDGRTLAACTYAGAFGPPAFFTDEHFEALRRLEGDHGARAIFEEHRPNVAWVDFPNGALDLDTPEDAERFRAHAAPKET